MARSPQLTFLLDKIGKEQAENDHANKVVPILKVRILHTW